MTTAPERPAPSGWSARRWRWGIALSLGVQLGLLFSLGEKPKPLPPRVQFGANIHLAADPWTVEQVTRLPGLTDPTLFALPHLHGFSGRAWLGFVPPSPQFWEWTEPPRWLTASTQPWGRAFSSLVASNAATPLLVADKPMPRLIGAALPIAPVPIRNRTELRLAGELAERRLVEPLDLPAWPHTELLSNSVVQAVVDAQGRVLSTVLLVGSGLADADLHALQQSRIARFEPVASPLNGPAAPTRGRMIFQWHTVPPEEADTPGTEP